MYSRCKYAWSDFFYHLVLTRRSRIYERFPFEIIDQVISLVRLLLYFFSYIYILTLSRLFANDISAFGANSHDILRVSWYQYRGGVTTTGNESKSPGVSLENINNPIEKPDRCVSLIINNVHVASTVDARNHRVGRKKDDSKERYEKKVPEGQSSLCCSFARLPFWFRRDHELVSKVVVSLACSGIA